MDREIIWSVWASDDLVSIAEDISRDSESYAATVVRELVAAAVAAVVVITASSIAVHRRIERLIDAVEEL
jgi:hypothetical protein